MAYYDTLHAKRDLFNELLYGFVSTQTWWKDDRARFFFEIDMLNRPFLYSNTPLKKPKYPLQHVNVLETSDRSYLVDIPSQYALLLGEIIGKKELGNMIEDRYVFRVDHKRIQYPFMPAQSLKDTADYCYGMIMRISRVLPVWIRSEHDGRG